MPEVPVAVLVTLNTKAPEAEYVCDCLASHGRAPFIIDISRRPHDVPGAEISGGDLAAAAGTTWGAMAEMDRTGASQTMIAGAIGIGGANGTAIGSAVMRELPLFMPKVMVSAVAATAALQWYVGESCIVMFPMIGDAALNRVTRRVMANAATAVAAMAHDWVALSDEPEANAPPPPWRSRSGATPRQSAYRMATGPGSRN
jgi:uncharacterized protein (UPF0261 family)